MTPTHPTQASVGEARHTKGPWKAVQYYSDSVSVIDADGFEIVSAAHNAVLLDYAGKLGIAHWADSTLASRELSEQEQAANARLIAAAPDLLACSSYGHADSPGLPCGDLLAAANILRNWGHDDLAARLEAKHEMERAAIARATSLPSAPTPEGEAK